MRVIPFTDGGIIMSGDEKRKLARELVQMTRQLAALEINFKTALQTIDTIVPLSDALSVACNELIDIVRPLADEDPALAARLDQIHAALKTAYEKVA